MPQNTFYTCPADCGDVLLFPAIDAGQDCTSYDQTLSQVSDLFLVPTGADDIFAAWATTPTYVADSIDNTLGDNTKAIHLVGEGSIPASEKTIDEYPKGKKKTTNRLYTLTFNIKNLSPANYAFLQAVQCGSTGFTFYYADRGGWVYGVVGGILPEFIDADLPKGEATTDKNIGTITLQFSSLTGDPQRRVNPLA